MSVPSLSLPKPAPQQPYHLSGGRTPKPCDPDSKLLIDCHPKPLPPYPPQDPESKSDLCLEKLAEIAGAFKDQLAETAASFDEQVSGKPRQSAGGDGAL